MPTIGLFISPVNPSAFKQTSTRCLLHPFFHIITLHLSLTPFLSFYLIRADQISHLCRADSRFFLLFSCGMMSIVR